MSSRTCQNNYKFPLFKVFMNQDIKNSISDVLLSGRISQYNKVFEFEKELSKFIRNDKIITLNSGTNALHLAYHLLKRPIPELNYPGLEKDSEVLTTPLTCVATNWPILSNNLKIKWVDIDPKTMNINLHDLKNKLTDKTRIISVVHWGGTPVDLDKLKEVQDYAEKKLGFRPMVIEDAAHSLGAEYDGRKLGNHGNIVMYSFQAIKHLTTIDGGLLVLPTDELYERGKLLRWFGISRERKNNQKDFRVEDDIKEFGFKFHMNDVNATVGLSNLTGAIKNLEIHRRNASLYIKNLKNIDGIKLLTINEKIKSSYWIFTFRIKEKENFITYMRENGICVSQVHGRNDTHTCVKEFKTVLPILDEVEKELICIPCGWWLTEKDINFIINCINMYIKKRAKLITCIEMIHME